MMTSVDGIYAIGDIRNTPFKQARLPPTFCPAHPDRRRLASPLLPPTPVSDASQPPRVMSAHQVVVAAADGCIAAMDIDRYLKNRKKVRVDWIHE